MSTILEWCERQKQPMTPVTQVIQGLVAMLDIACVTQSRLSQHLTSAELQAMRESKKYLDKLEQADLCRVTTMLCSPIGEDAGNLVVMMTSEEGFSLQVLCDPELSRLMVGKGSAFISVRFWASGTIQAIKEVEGWK